MFESIRVWLQSPDGKATTMREFFRSKFGSVVAVVVVLAGVVFAAMTVIATFGDGDAAAMSNEGYFVCTETGKPFRHRIVAGETVPVQSPFSGQATGVPAELCYWTAEGKIRDEPSVVLLNASAGKKGPTYCPDCGRLVVRDNPPPIAGFPPPLRTNAN
jgi:hypothetical protein